MHCKICRIRWRSNSEASPCWCHGLTDDYEADHDVQGFFTVSDPLLLRHEGLALMQRKNLKGELLDSAMDICLGANYTVVNDNYGQIERDSEK